MARMRYMLFLSISTNILTLLVVRVTVSIRQNSAQFRASNRLKVETKFCEY